MNPTTKRVFTLYYAEGECTTHVLSYEVAEGGSHKVLSSDLHYESLNQALARKAQIEAGFGASNVAFFRCSRVE